MNHHLLKAGIKWLVPYFQMMGMFLLFRGHNEPGGGFIAGLVIGAGFVMKYLRTERDPSQFKIWGLSSMTWIGVGLMLALSSGFLGSILNGSEYMTGTWQGQIWLPIVGNTKFGTPFYFDMGVFFVVIGVIQKVFLLFEEESWKSS
jgi:multisubunit Na+/H+ antiporter MnhB subunit